MKSPTKKKYAVVKRTDDGSYWWASVDTYVEDHYFRNRIPILYTDSHKIATYVTRRLNEEREIRA